MENLVVFLASIPFILGIFVAVFAYCIFCMISALWKHFKK
nr:MAG TPA: hypothetical protein [Bacteriophage sp.]